MSTARATTTARSEVRQVAPKLIELSEKVLYPDVWERPGLAAGRIAKKVFEETKA